MRSLSLPDALHIMSRCDRLNAPVQQNYLSSEVIGSFFSLNRTVFFFLSIKMLKNHIDSPRCDLVRLFRTSKTKTHKRKKMNQYFNILGETDDKEAKTGGVYLSDCFLFTVKPLLAGFPCLQRVHKVTFPCIITQPRHKGN